MVIHELFGLNDDIRALSDRLATMGYLSLAPDFYAGGKWTRCMRGAFAQLKVGHGEFFDTIDAARRRLVTHEDCSGRVGVIGFCLGGGFALLAAAQQDFAVASVNYGEDPEDGERALAGACPIVASYGGRDRTMRGRPERLEAALVRAGVSHDIKTYPDAGHSFLSTTTYPRPTLPLAKLMGMSAGPHAASAADAWQRIDDYFANYLKG